MLCEHYFATKIIDHLKNWLTSYVNFIKINANETTTSYLLFSYLNARIILDKWQSLDSTKSERIKINNIKRDLKFKKLYYDEIIHHDENFAM